MTPYFLILLSVIWFTLAAWLAKQSYDLGTVVGRSIGSRLLWMSYASVAALALWPMARQPVSFPSPVATSVAAEFVEPFYVAFAVDDQLLYHSPSCPDVPKMLTLETREKAESFGRRPHQACIRQTGVSVPAP